MAADTNSEMIRILCADDVEAFRRIRLEALRVEPSSYASSAEDWESLSEDEWRRRLQDTRVFVVFRQDEPVAIMGMKRQPASKMAHRATVVMVYVRATLRGQGWRRGFWTGSSSTLWTTAYGNWSLRSAPKTQRPSNSIGEQALSRRA